MFIKDKLAYSGEDSKFPMGSSPYLLPQSQGCSSHGFCFKCRIIVGDPTCFCAGGNCPKCGCFVSGQSFPKDLDGIYEKHNRGHRMIKQRYENGDWKETIPVGDSDKIYAPLDDEDFETKANPILQKAKPSEIRGRIKNYIILDDASPSFDDCFVEVIAKKINFKEIFEPNEKV